MEYFLGFVFICLVLGAVGIYKRDKSKESEIVEEEPAKEEQVKISEPVISFLKVFNENPKRFKLQELFKEIEGLPVIRRMSGYKLTDSILNESWEIQKDELYSQIYHSRIRYTQVYSDGYNGWPKWMTREEREYVFLNLRTYYTNRRKTRDMILQTRAKRKQDKERQRLMNLYCK